jgi:hypothetical protein
LTWGSAQASRTTAEREPIAGPRFQPKSHFTFPGALYHSQSCDLKRIASLETDFGCAVATCAGSDYRDLDLAEGLSKLLGAGLAGQSQGFWMLRRSLDYQQPDSV